MSDNIEYDTTHMRRMVLNDVELYYAYIALKKEAENPELTANEIEETALEALFNERMQESNFIALWYKLLPPPDDMPLLPEGKIAKTVREMVGHYGWREYAKGLAEYLENKRRELKGCGLQNRAKVWEYLRDQIMKTVKRRVVD